MSGAPPRAEAPSLAPALGAASAAVLAAMAWRILADPGRVNHDCANLLMGALQWSEGRMPFAGFAGMNPPLTSYFCLAAVGIARLFGWSVGAAHSFLVFLLCAGSVLLVRRVLARSPGLSPAFRGAVLLGWALATATAVGPEFALGEREQLWLAGFVPYLLLRNARGEGATLPRGPAVAAGILAAFGCLLKPHFVLAALACEIALRLVHRRAIPLLAPEVVAGAGTALLYAAHFLLLPGDYLRAFLAAARAAAAGYGAYRSPPGFLLFVEPYVPIAILTGILAFLILATGSSAPRRLAAACGAFTLAGVGTYLLQAKGWGYHALPAVAGALLTAAALVADLAERRLRAGGGLVRAAGLAARLALAAAAFAAGIAGARAARGGPGAIPRGAVHQALLRWTAPHDEVLFLTSSVPLIYPALLEADRRGVGAFYGPLMQVAFFRAAAPAPEYPARAGMRPDERAFLEEIEEEVLARRPRALFVAVSRNYGCPPGFSFVEWLRAAGSFDGALAPYRKVDTVNDRWGTLEVYRRAEESASPMEPATNSSMSRVNPG